MSRKRRNQTKPLSLSAEPIKLDSTVKKTGDNQIGSAASAGLSPLPNRANTSAWFSYLKNHWWAAAIIACLSIGVFGAGLKYLEEDAKRQSTVNQANPLKKPEVGLLNTINPFLSNPLPSPTPQLAKEYIYAGSRLLAAEDANAAAAPPADLAIWRPSTGVWWVMGGPGSQQFAAGWGANGDIPAPGDYDGDGKTDLAVFRPTAGAWYVFKSSDNNWFGVSFGMGSDTPVAADYDGDGKTDIAVYRPSNGTWYILRSSDSGVTYQAFGLSTDTPAAADYDGDGKTDISVWRAGSPATFYVLRSSNGQVQGANLGQTGDLPVSADYDGDGKADYAVRSGTNWNFLYSSNNQTQTIQWQLSTDKAVQNDYDGDGKVDIAVWRDSNGNWYIRKSSDGQLRQEQWGIPGDIPVPALYRR
jgi:hypothetical protein